MKIWLSGNNGWNIILHPVKPKFVESSKLWDSDAEVPLCITYMRKLLRGSGYRLPRPNTDDLVEI